MGLNYQSIRKLGSGCGLIASCIVIAACSLAPKIPVVSDERLDLLVRSEARQLLSVADPGADASAYQFQISNFPRADLLGLSLGGGRIYISYKLAQLASQTGYHRWLLRQTLAHEIAHELAGHVHQNGAVANTPSGANGVSAQDLGLATSIRFQNYPVEKELQADLLGLTYWAQLGWDCGIWVDILRAFQKAQYAGDVHHPTDRRLQQAMASCAAMHSAQLSMRH
jgi:predicted Zn-dependent protease